jgi:hypothetical protein
MKLKRGYLKKLGPKKFVLNPLSKIENILRLDKIQTSSCLYNHVNEVHKYSEGAFFLLIKNTIV